MADGKGGRYERAKKTSKPKRVAFTAPPRAKPVQAPEAKPEAVVTAVTVSEEGNDNGN